MRSCLEFILLYVAPLSLKRTKGVWRSGVITSPILNVGAVYGVSGQHHAPASLLPGETALSIHWIGDWGCLNISETRKT